MKSLLAAKYEELSVSERCNAIALARQEGEREAKEDSDGPFADGTTPRQPERSLYFYAIVEPAWQADLIDDSTFAYWQALEFADWQAQEDEGEDPRVQAFLAAWTQAMRERAEEEQNETPHFNE
jgi:hypothetical protein